MNCAVAITFSSLAFLSSSISMVTLSHALFSSLALLSSSISKANLYCLLATTFSSLRFLSNSLSLPRFFLLRVTRHCFLCFSVFLFSHHIPSLSFLCIKSLKVCLHKFPISKEHFFFVLAKAACIVEMNNVGVTGRF